MKKGKNRGQRTRKENRDSKVDKRYSRSLEAQHEIKEDLGKKNNFKPVQAKNDFQKRVIKALETRKVIVISSCAGTGKSYLAMCKALEDQLSSDCKINLARPAVGMSTSLGLLKGGIREKYEPYLMPLISVIKDSLGAGYYECGLKNGNIELMPFEYLRGLNLDGWTIADEAQNCKASELYSVLTRITETGKLILLGDKTQHDLEGQDGITWLKRFVYDNDLHDQVEFIEGDSDDIVRSEFVKAVVKAREKETGKYTN